jgi:O-antigen ligase
MSKDLKGQKVLSSFIQASYILFFIGLVFSFRAISSITTGFILVAGIIKNKPTRKYFFHGNWKNLFLAGCILFYLLQFVSLLYTHNIHEGWNNIRLKSGLLFIPLAVCFSGHFNADNKRKIFSGYCIILAIASLYCIGAAFLHYWKTTESSQFFYHALVSPFKHHAVYFSILVFIALVFLFEGIKKNNLVINRAFHISLITFFSIFLFLLSSKLIIAFYLLHLIFYFIGLFKNTATNRIFIISSFLLFITIAGSVLLIHNPVSERFYEIINGDLKIISRDKFNQGDYFNGLQFRLLQWRFAPEILNEHHRWWIGVSPGDAQFFLDQKYISANMYTGDNAGGGFLHYNTHNQFLVAMLQTGIIGLSVLLVICFSLIKMAWLKKSMKISFIIMLLLAWLFTESAFETQYGILIFTFFPLFIPDDKK